MRAYRLFLEPDRDVPEFKRLACEEIEVSLRDVLLKGYFPFPDPPGRSVEQAVTLILEKLNMPEFEFAAVNEAFSISRDLVSNMATRDDWRIPYSFTDCVGRISGRVYFAGNLTFQELFDVAWKYLQAGWNSVVAGEMLRRCFYAFSERRQFLKTKDESISVCSRGDIASLDLGAILSPEDFRNQERLVIECGIPGEINFRREAALDRITRDGVFSLGRPIDRMQAVIDGVFYYCERRGGSIRAIPVLQKRRARSKARRIAAQFGKTRYCFTAGIEEFEKRLGKSRIEFPLHDESFSPADWMMSAVAAVTHVGIRTVKVAAIPTHTWTLLSLRRLLREHGEKVSGTKKIVIERLADLAARLYEKHEKRLRKLFRRKYIRVGSRIGSSASKTFPSPGNGGSVERLITAMFIVRHLRGDCIIDAAYENTVYSNKDVALALLKQEVSLPWAFVEAP